MQGGGVSGFGQPTPRRNRWDIVSAGAGGNETPIGRGFGATPSRFTAGHSVATPNRFGANNVETPRVVSRFGDTAEQSLGGSRVSRWDQKPGDVQSQSGFDTLQPQAPLILNNQQT